MYAVEFRTTIDDGVIRIPIEYQGRFTKGVRVILLAEEIEGTETYIDKLLARPLKVKDFRPLTREDIYER